VLGSALAFSGSFLGAVLAFVVSRASFGQPLGKRVDLRLLSWLQTQFDRHGWKVVAFVRLNPIFPGPVNFLFGLTSIRFSTYVAATGLFLLPPTIVFATVGHSLGTLAFRRGVTSVRMGALLAGVAILVIAAAVLLFYFGQRIRETEPGRVAPER
jgi:uncharacterized membrane protein YdjX (TVP38/TMEM64 family)